MGLMDTDFFLLYFLETISKESVRPSEAEGFTSSVASLGRNDKKGVSRSFLSSTLSISDGGNIDVFHTFAGFGVFNRSGLPGQTSKNSRPISLQQSVSPIPFSQMDKVEFSPSKKIIILFGMGLWEDGG